MFEISKTASFEVVMFRPAAVDVRPQVPRIVCETHAFVDLTFTCTHSHATSTAMSQPLSNPDRYLYTENGPKNHWSFV